MELQRITAGITGQEAAEIIYNNDESLGAEIAQLRSEVEELESQLLFGETIGNIAAGAEWTAGLAPGSYVKEQAMLADGRVLSFETPLALYYDAYAQILVAEPVLDSGGNVTGMTIVSVTQIVKKINEPLTDVSEYNITFKKGQFLGHNASWGGFGIKFGGTGRYWFGGTSNVLAGMIFTSFRWTEQTFEFVVEYKSDKSVGQQVFDLSTGLQDIQNRVLTLEKATINDFRNKTLLLLGDSLTASNNWQSTMQSICNFKTVTVLAKDGYTWSNYPETVYKPAATYADPHNAVIWNQYNSFVEKVNAGTLEIPDYVFIMAGANDGYWGKIVGEVDYTVNLSTIIAKEVNTVVKIGESVQYIIGLFQQNFPSVKIIVATPPVQPRINNPVLMYNIARIIQEAARYCAVSCIDVFGNCGINSLTASTYLWSDGVHLNTNGAKLVGEYIALEFFNRLNRN